MTADQNVKVLIAEDDRLIGLMLRRELEKLGYTVVGEAANGEQIEQAITAALTGAGKG